MKMRNVFVAAIVAAIVTPWQPAAACSSCGCTLGTEWVSEGYTASSGLRLDLRYDYINQDELRTGTHTASAADIQHALGAGTAQETQRYTLTRFYTVALDYGFNRDWGVNVQVPMLRRTHGTLAEGDAQPSFSSKSGIGDVSIVGRYQGIFDDRSFGVQLGVKLPTGAFDQAFSEGPQAGALLDRGLQLGTGTTDAIAGVYHFAAFSRDWDHFEQLQIKVPLNERENFKPGSQLSANLGFRYVGWRSVVPQLQLNFKAEGRESGAEADRPNSGSREIYLSPGLGWQPAKAIWVYGFVQLPVYRDYDGLQLAPHYSVTTGLRYAF